MKVRCVDIDEWKYGRLCQLSANSNVLVGSYLDS